MSDRAKFLERLPPDKTVHFPDGKKTEMPKGVRFAGSNEEDQIWELMQMAYEEQPIFPLCEQKMREKIRTCLASKVSDREGMIGVIGEPGKIEGYIIAVFSTYWYTTSMHLEELSNFVHPDHRHAWKGHARNLIEFAKWFTETVDLPLIFGILSTQRLEGKIRLYQRQAKMVGAVFAHNTGHLGGLLSERG